MSIVTSYDWESDTYTNHLQVDLDTDTLDQHQRFLDAVDAAVERAKTALPTHDQRIMRAQALVLDGHVTDQQDGTFLVKSQGKTSTRQYRVNGKCECPDSVKVSDSWCKHALAVAIYRRARRIMQEPAQTPSAAVPEPTAADSAAPIQHVETAVTVPQKYLVMIQGKAFIRYCGLLAMARERGLVSLTADWTYNSEDLSLAHAVAVFADGRRFEESGDASPANCTRMVAVHFRRVALTRAKARVLRDALGIDLVAVEELADSD